MMRDGTVKLSDFGYVIHLSDYSQINFILQAAFENKPVSQLKISLYKTKFFECLALKPILHGLITLLTMYLSIKGNDNAVFLSVIGHCLVV